MRTAKVTAPKPTPPKVPWYKQLAAAVGTAIGQAKFGG